MAVGCLITVAVINDYRVTRRGPLCDDPTYLSVCRGKDAGSFADRVIDTLVCRQRFVKRVEKTPTIALVEELNELNLNALEGE